ncbi:3-hydroxyacyl-CoA dehydrogenase family protein [Saccharopolyspora gloriosae]|uniref:3-hydroxyacyl-CoA dehydrogenase family protein n=1 Tax=Saccharopolyspora gloriosae TaxID=455344 RepID=UPI001FB72C5B|nr:3-hydroxyacyl-CoA dehydrogenase NAD-binding domain-containing protein [Saccharopolyspora gloriosae]
MSGFSQIGVAGAGVMGAEVAQVAATAGHEVVLLDLSDEVLNRARSGIRSNLRFQRMFAEGAPAVNAEEVLGRITFTTSAADFAEVEIVIENITEKWDAKEDLYRRLDRICADSTVFAVNTSVIPITKVGAVTGRMDRVIGTHFMNPVSRKPTVEVIRGHHTSDETVSVTLGMLESLGKRGIVVQDSPGFVSNRVLMLTVNEAIFLLHEGVATAEQVDDIFVTCFGHAMGPLATADLIGLDTILYSIEGLYEHFNDSKYRPCPLLRRMVDAGLHGCKNGAGFFQYANSGSRKGIS